MKQFWHAVFILCSLAAPSYAQTETISKQKYPRDGQLKLYVYHTDTFADLTYLNADGQWDEAVYEKIKSLLRSYTDDKITAIDKRLIELADHLQDHFGVDTIEVISGYRSPEYNRQLKDGGHNVANESFHTQGLALDIHIDEIDETVVRDRLKKMNLGGVGYYGSKLMVHMDFGPDGRFWQEAGFTQNTEVGIFNPAATWRFRTQRFYYNAMSAIKLTASPLPKSLDHFQVQHFFRGKWRPLCVSGDQDCVRMIPAKMQDGQIAFAAETILAHNENRFGKYRIRYESDGVWQNSNEFYIKR